MKKITQRIYSTYCLLVFTVVFALLFPIFLVFIQQPSWHKYALRLNRFWARLFFAFCAIPVEQEFEQKIDRSDQYVFCANHFSFLDIPIIGLTRHSFVYVGKSSLAAIPGFGYMYRKLHITVDRSKLKSKYDSLLRSIEAIEQGKSLVMFPEGGIMTKSPPQMARFKDGAFRIAIEKQIPIVPVTIPYNWIILPDDGRLLVNWRRLKIIYHRPIHTKGLTMKDLNQLKNQTFAILEAELKRYNLNGDQ